MNTWRILVCIVTISGITSCKDETTSVVNSWNEDAEARISNQGTENVEAGFTAPLSESLGPNLTITGGSGTIAFDTTRGVLLAGALGSDDDGRVYVGTNASNFISPTNIGFVAEVSVTINPGDHNAETAFFGVGEGLDPNHAGVGPSYDEPSGGSAFAYFGVRDNPGGRTIVNDNKHGKNGSNLTPQKKIGPGTHRLRLTYDGTQLHLSVQIKETGSFVEHLSIDVSDNGFDETNSRIFFGGSNEATFSNFEILSITTTH